MRSCDRRVVIADCRKLKINVYDVWVASSGIMLVPAVLKFRPAILQLKSFDYRTNGETLSCTYAFNLCTAFKALVKTYRIEKRQSKLCLKIRSELPR